MIITEMHMYDHFNRRAKFLPMTLPETLPCLEVAGVQVHAYIDQRGTFRLSVHLDTTDPELITPRDTVPIQFAISGDLVWHAD